MTNTVKTGPFRITLQLTPDGAFRAGTLEHADFTVEPDGFELNTEVHPPQALTAAALPALFQGMDAAAAERIATLEARAAALTREKAEAVATLQAQVDALTSQFDQLARDRSGELAAMRDQVAAANEQLGAALAHVERLTSQLAAMTPAVEGPKQEPTGE